MSDPDHPAIPAPWVLLDDHTVEQSAALLERLTSWLTGPDRAATPRCARALSLGETTDPHSIATWADALAARLRQRAADNQL